MLCLSHWSIKVMLPAAVAAVFLVWKITDDRQRWIGFALPAFCLLGFGICGRAETVRQAERMLGVELEDVRVTVEGRIVRLSEREWQWEYLLADVALTADADSLANAGLPITPEPSDSGGLSAGPESAADMGQPAGEGQRIRLEGLLVIAADYCEAVEGDRISAVGEIACFDGATNPGQFDYAAYQAAFGINLRMDGETVSLLRAGERKGDGWLGRFRRYAVGIFRSASPDEGGTMAAIVLGDKTDLPDQRYQLYLDSGIGHILTLSGLHLSLIGGGLYGILRKKMTLPAWLSAMPIGLIILIYVRLIGSGISASRAAIAILCSLLAGCIGKSYDSLSSASLGMLIILCQYPLQIARPAFWMSFGAVFAIGGLAPELTQWLAPRRTWERALIGVTAIQLALMPVISVSQYTLQPYSILLNMLIIPAMGLVVGGCAAVLLAGIVYMPAAAALAVPLKYAFGIMDWLCRASQQLPGSRMAVGCPSAVRLAVYGAVLIGFLLYIYRRNLTDWKTQGQAEPSENKKKIIYLRRRCAMLAVLLLMTAVLGLDIGKSRLEMAFLDVGQGDCICIRAPNGTTVLVDGGSSSLKKVGEYRIMPYLAWAGIGRIDYLVMTHLDDDHTNGLIELLQSGFKADYLLLPASTTELGKMEEICEICERNGTKVVMISKNSRIESGEVEIKCVYPSSHDHPDSENEASVVLEITYGGFSCLLTGDLEGDGEKAVRDYLEGNLPITLLKVAHHGSRNSTSEEFLRAAGPAAAVISCGRNNSYGHPHEELMERLTSAGCDIFVTADCGAVLVSTDGVSWEIGGYVP